MWILEEGYIDIIKKSLGEWNVEWIALGGNWCKNYLVSKRIVEVAEER
jgi:hypothetical protein